MDDGVQMINQYVICRCDFCCGCLLISTSHSPPLADLLVRNGVNANQSCFCPHLYIRNNTGQGKIFFVKRKKIFTHQCRKMKENVVGG